MKSTTSEYKASRFMITTQAFTLHLYPEEASMDVSLKWNCLLNTPPFVPYFLRISALDIHVHCMHIQFMHLILSRIIKLTTNGIPL